MSYAEFQEALGKFKDAAIELDRAWGDVEEPRMTEAEDARANENYPFDLDFTEKMSQIMEWEFTNRQPPNGMTFEERDDKLMLQLSEVLANPPDAEVQRVGKAFSRAIRAELSEWELGEVRKSNESNRGTDRQKVCATHDYTDANMVMLAAISESLLESEDTITRAMFGNEGQLDNVKLWNDAWSLAKDLGFTIG